MTEDLLLRDLAVLLVTAKPFALVFHSGLRLHLWLEPTFTANPWRRLELTPHLRTCALVPADKAVLIDARAFRADEPGAARLYQLETAKATAALEASQ